MSKSRSFHGLLRAAALALGLMAVPAAAANISVRVAPTIQAVAYSSGQAMGGLQTLKWFRNTQSPGGVLDQVTLSWRGTESIPLTFYIFDSKPSAATICTDNTAFSLAAADASALAVAPFVLSAVAPTGTTLTSASSALAVSIQNSEASLNLYVCTVVGGSVTPAVGDLTYRVSGVAD